MPARILVVDNDPWIQRIVATILGQRGHLVNLAGDAQGALACAMKIPPDVVVTTVGLPAVGGWSWWERLRTLPEREATPVIFLTGPGNEPADIRGFESGGDGRLHKPFRIEDLEKLVQVLLTRARASSSADTAPTRTIPPLKPSAGHRPLSAFRGSLNEIGLSSLMVLLEMERKTGILLLEQSSTSARLFLRKGRVIRAEIDGPDRRLGRAAVFAVLEWAEGQFDFLIGDVGGIDEIQTSTTFLLLEGARRIDETNHEKVGGL